MGLGSSLQEWAVRLWLNKQVKEGTMIGKVWTWLNGKKTLVGAVIALIGFAPQIAALLPSLGVDAALAAKIAGAAVALVGIAHKVYKFLYKEEAP